MTISAHNATSSRIRVSVNRWGTDGDTDYYTIEAGKNETWDRIDPRGFVMTIDQHGSVTPYYVMSDSNITVYADRVTDNNKTLKPANDNVN